MSKDRLVALSAQRTATVKWESYTASVDIGKDILELLGSGMYVEPISIYREYIQNAADSIEAAQQEGVLTGEHSQHVTINVSRSDRTVKIRDYGLGLKEDEFIPRLTTVGASKKQGTSARGFRGIGRLAGLGYCQELIFRSRALRESRVSELKWDCRKLRSLLRDEKFDGDITKLIQETVTTRQASGRGCPPNFFEVEMTGIVRYRDDQLLNTAVIGGYLSEIAPVPFAPEFQYGGEITEALKDHVKLGNIGIHINGSTIPVYRSHRNTIEFQGQIIDKFTGWEPIKIPAVGQGWAAVGWILHHEYIKSLPTSTRVSGLRLRSGNIQIGDEDILSQVFPERRFNGWAVGEIHVLDPMLIPNGRRDHFEPNTHLANLMNHLTPISREIGRLCRTSSIQRKVLKDFERYTMLVNEKAAILGQGSLSKTDYTRIVDQIEETFVLLNRLSEPKHLGEQVDEGMKIRISNLRQSVEHLLKRVPKESALKHISNPKRRAYQHVIALIYECHPNQSAAKDLVDKILAKLK
jgi:hypothetical protein